MAEEHTASGKGRDDVGKSDPDLGAGTKEMHRRRLYLLGRISSLKAELKAIQEERKGMLGTSEDADELLEHQLESPLRVARRQFGNWRWLSDDQLHVRNEIDNQSRVRSKCVQHMTHHAAVHADGLPVDPFTI